MQGQYDAFAQISELHGDFSLSMSLCARNKSKGMQLGVSLSMYLAGCFSITYHIRAHSDPFKKRREETYRGNRRQYLVSEKLSFVGALCHLQVFQSSMAFHTFVHLNLSPAAVNC